MFEQRKGWTSNALEYDPAKEYVPAKYWVISSQWWVWKPKLLGT